MFSVGNCIQKLKHSKIETDWLHTLNHRGRRILALG